MKHHISITKWTSHWTLSTFFVLFSFILSSCYLAEDKRLEYALDFAGENRGELEAVLRHYNNNPQKLEAAKFLIRNMPHYYSYRGWQLDKIKIKLKMLSKIKEVSDMTIVADSQLEHPNLSVLKKVYDSHTITSHFLIDNIDRAFDVWKKRPWNKSLDFDDFCELILPYRIGNEPLTDWRSIYEKRYGRILDSLYNGSDVLTACRMVNEIIEADGFEYYSRFKIPHTEATFLFSNRIGSCREMCDIGIYAMRACGIPVAMDVYKWSPSYQGSHQWLVVRDTTGKYVQFGFDGVVARRDTICTDGRKKGKVYRNCFGIQSARVRQISALLAIPPTIGNAYQKDVTAEYFGKNSTSVFLEAKPTGDVFLGVFSPKGWIPIDVAECNNNFAVFQNLEPEVVYAPIALTDSGYEAIGYPFITDRTHRLHILKGDVTTSVPMILSRKMPLMPLMKMRLEKCIVGAKIDASTDSLFQNAHLIHRFSNPLSYCHVRLACHDVGKVRYLRYTSPAGVPIELGEIAAYSDTACSKSIPLRLITPIPSAYFPKNITDGNMLTAFYAPTEYKSLVFDMGRQTDVNTIDFYPRTDGNFIVAGDTYELFFQNGANGWKSLGRKKSDGQFVKFSGSSGALFWLHDITRGKEEQVFVYEDGRQLFVEDMRINK